MEDQGSLMCAFFQVHHVDGQVRLCRLAEEGMVPESTMGRSQSDAMSSLLLGKPINHGSHVDVTLKCTT